MNSPAHTQRSLRGIRRDVPAHLFSIGQSVRLKGGFGIPVRTADIYRVTATLPHRDGSLQYRIRSDDERHERVAAEDNLEAISTSATGDANLMERTFGNG